MQKDYVIAIENGWQLELIKDTSGTQSEPACYLTFHGGVQGEIVVKECLFRTIMGEIPENVKMKARRAVAANRDELEATWQYNKDHLSDG